jgi:hypothetical protein
VSPSPTLPPSHCSALRARPDICFVPYTSLPCIVATSTKSDFLVSTRTLEWYRAARRVDRSPTPWHATNRIIVMLDQPVPHARGQSDLKESTGGFYGSGWHGCHSRLARLPVAGLYCSSHSPAKKIGAVPSASPSSTLRFDRPTRPPRHMCLDP